ncbi:Obscurin, partial [Araneus ventricosus]
NNIFAILPQTTAVVSGLYTCCFPVLRMKGNGNKYAQENSEEETFFCHDYQRYQDDSGKYCAGLKAQRRVWSGRHLRV